ncbi:MAG: hypothetical protein CMH22_04940 [Methylophaga sp.]|nr:hypothetical protein [Methylophaga sp.]|tara:strand:+ start:42599 stop:43480 length:882 start_codon:yes stop_codon:yes gene_type:complete
MSDEYWIEWKDPADDTLKYFALSPDTGHFWTSDVNDPCIVDGAELEVIYTIDDTLKQIGEKWKLKKGVAYERHNLFKHPSEHAWLAVEKKPTGQKDEDGKVIRAYKAFWSRKFKSVVCVSRLTGQRQGNPQMQNKEYAQASAAKAKAERKKRLANAQETAKKLNFDPLKRLALYAMGDKEQLGLKEEVKPSIQMKALETYLKYSHQVLKPYSPQEMEKLRNDNSGPRVNVILPSNAEEVPGTVLQHKDEASLERYLKSGSQRAYEEIEDELNSTDEYFERDYAKIEIPDIDQE